METAQLFDLLMETVYNVPLIYNHLLACEKASKWTFSFFWLNEKLALTANTSKKYMF